ncbi:hypothetical protein [Halogranum rubrum]|uniref:hypothetical protein n=1 Tax=Halogranum rubrum TaxID=553466 RepID=UPI001C42F00E|nr:hypothetical protein [Halogranum rubrum]
MGEYLRFAVLCVDLIGFPQWGGLRTVLSTIERPVRDLVELPTNRLNSFDIMLSLLAAYTDYIVGVLEKESGGEAPELGEIDDAPYFEKSYVFPRDYTWVSDTNLVSKQHVIQAAVEIAFTGELSGDETQTEITSLVKRAQVAEIDVSEQEVWDVVDERESEGNAPATYSWVHLNKFRKFELHGRCLP